MMMVMMMMVMVMMVVMVVDGDDDDDGSSGGGGGGGGGGDADVVLTIHILSRYRLLCGLLTRSKTALVHCLLCLLSTSLGSTKISPNGLTQSRLQKIEDKTIEYYTQVFHNMNSFEQSARSLENNKLLLNLCAEINEKIAHANSKTVFRVAPSISSSRLDLRGLEVELGPINKEHLIQISLPEKGQTITTKQQG